jgi:hypothetical protein
MSSRLTPSGDRGSTSYNREMTLMTRFPVVFLRALAGSLLLLAVIWVSTDAADAAVPPAPRLQANLIAVPTNFKAGTFLETSNGYELVLTNIGGAPVTGTVDLKIKLAPGVTIEEINTGSQGFGNSCSGTIGGSEIECEVPELRPSASNLFFSVKVSSLATRTLTNEVEVDGGGAPPFSESFPNPASEEKAPFSILQFASGPTGPAGESDQVAGDHPTSFNTLLTSPIETTFGPGEIVHSGQIRGPVKNDKDIVIDLPPGVVGNPNAAAKCPIQVFLAQQPSSSDCPPGSQIGEFTISGQGAVYQGNQVGERNPIFNVDPEPGYPAEFGLYDNGLSHGVLAPATLAHTGQGYVVRVIASELITGVFGPYFLQTSFFGNPQVAAGLPGVGKSLLTSPANCSGQPLRTEVHLDLWSNPASVPLRADASRDFGAANFSDPQWYSASSESPPVSGCESLRFDPSITLKTDETTSDSPSGLKVDVSVPQNEDPDGLATPPLRDATVALPEGLFVDPSVASGLAGCASAQLAPDSTDPGACPLASKIGTATLHTPLIEHQLEGSVFIGTPECSPCTNVDAASGKFLKLYIEINDPPTGVVVKLPGTVTADPTTGQLTASFTENPQLPFEDLELNLKSGSRAPLTTPPACGRYTTTTDLKPWSAPQSGPDAKPQASFNVTSGPGGTACAGLANAPAFEAGTTVPLAGTYSPFVLKVSRENGSQRISSLDATLPAGLVGKLAGVPYCSNGAIAAAASKSGAAEQAAPSCPLSSEVGTVNVGAGSGTPFYVQGHAYLAGPYKGAPLSLEIITPAVAGPFDLGTVAVRTALYVNESTAQIHAVSDPIPSILAGIPLDIRSIALNMNKPEFTLNPTSCNAVAVLGSTTSTLGQTASLQNRFQVGGCKGLAFKPELKLAFTGATKRTGFPAVKAVLTQPKGQNANLAGAQVILPKGMLIANAHINSPCTRVQFNSGGLPGEGCPAKSILGTAKVWTPLLEKPEEGKVYFRSNGGERQLPDLAVALRGQIPLQLVGFIDSVGKKGAEVRRVRTRFQSLPDAPVSRFELKLSGGKKGLLQNSKNLCKVNDKATFDLTGQNGATHDTEPKVQVKCAKGKGGAKKGAKKSGGGKKK